MRKLKILTPSGELSPLRGERSFDLPAPISGVLEGRVTPKEALERDALTLPRSTRQNLLRPGEELDPVLRHHLRK
ncbi:MAG: hypothetical protein JOY54_07975 [Acidobacteriaceae bacterium]|nr:hypothetical protein [Acidobacteriaceae bacterium]